VLFTSRAPIGLVAIAGIPVCTNQGFKSLVPGPDVDSSYLYWCIRRHAARIAATGSGSTFAEVSKEVVARFQIPLPRLAEQRRIAAVLDKADAIPRKRWESLRLLDEFVRSAFLQMFGDPVRNEKGWEIRPLEELIDPNRPITYGILKPGPHAPEGVPYIRVVDIANGSVNWRGVRRTTRAIADAYHRSTLKAGDVLLSIRGHVGRVAVTPPELEGGNITQDTARLALLPRYSLEYVAACLSSSPMQRLMRRYVRGVAVTGINLGDVKRLAVPVPPAEIQQRFRRLGRRREELATRAGRHLEAAESLFDSLAHQAFRGEL